MFTLLLDSWWFSGVQVLILVCILAQFSVLLDAKGIFVLSRLTGNRRGNLADE